MSMIKNLTGKVFNTVSGKILIPDQQDVILDIGDIIEYDGVLYQFMGVPMLAGATSETKLSLVIEEIKE